VRTLILTEIPAPFRIPLFNRLAETRGVTLRAVFLSDHDPRRNYAIHEGEMTFDRVTLPGRDISGRRRWLVLNRGVTRALRSFGPETIILGGWNQPAFWLARRYARRRGLPFFIWVESTRDDARLEGAVSDFLRRAFIRGATGFLVPGSASRAYVRSLGVDDADIHTAPNAVDTAIFADQVAAARLDRAALRARLGLEGIVVLYVGRFAPEKGLDVLLEAARGQRWQLVVAGAGREERSLKAAASRNVQWPGYLQRDELVPWYASADVFALPSRSEPWGMVLNEAAAAGLPIVASARVGAAADLVVEGRNGYVVPPNDVEALRSALNAIAEDTQRREAFGAHSLELAQLHTPERWAEAVSTAIQSVSKNE
jgi:glycosyltransferase involved in cell wall biosynthesis